MTTESDAILAPGADGSPPPPGTGDPTPPAATPAAPGPASATPPTEDRPTGGVVVDGREYTPDHVRRLVEQAAGASKLAQTGVTRLGRDLEAMGLTPAAAIEALRTLSGPRTPPMQTPVRPEAPTAPLPSPNGLAEMVAQQVDQRLFALETQRAFAHEERAAREALAELGVDVNGPTADVHLQGLMAALTLGDVDPATGQPRPGTSLIDERGEPIPATPRQVRAAAERYAAELARAAHAVQTRRLGPRPPVPPGTGSGTAGPTAPKVDVWAMSDDDRKAYAEQNLQRAKARSGGGTASSVT